jgi:hypothetical protein
MAMLYVQGDDVTTRSPILDQLGRLAMLLQDYERDDLWLHVVHVHEMRSQHAQVVVAVEDRNGNVLTENTGRVRPHTFRIDSSQGPVSIGRRFHVVRDEDGVIVK